MAKHNLTHTEMIEALKAVEKYGSVTEAALQLGINRSTLSGRVREAKTQNVTTKELSKDQVIKELKQKLKEQENEQVTAYRIRKQIYNLSERPPDPPEWLIEPKKPGITGVPMALWSDWHFGEKVNKEEVGGVNSYNITIAKRRAKQLVETIIDLCFNHMARPEYPGIIVNLAGDMISGEIHEELAITNEKETLRLLLDLQDILAASLTTLADKFKRVFVPCVVGNHGRTTKKPRMKSRVYTSFEWNLYCQLERHFKNDQRIKFLVPVETDAYYKVYNHRFLLTHGDSLGVKGGDGIIGAIGPIVRGAIKVGKSESQIGRDFDTILMGHWHQLLTLPGIVVNGAFKGYDEFARLALRVPYQRPSQAFWFLHPKHGMTGSWPIYLEELKQTTDSQQWVSWLA